MSGAFGKAWQLLKEVYPPPNYTEVGGEDAALAEAEKKWQARFAPEEVQEFTPPPVETKPLPNDFFDNHVHGRLIDRERIHNENEETEVRDRITDAMQGYVDKFGNYKLGVPKHIAIRTHLLNNHRQPDLSNEKSNGDSIVGIVRPNRRNSLAPKLETVMLRRSELSHAPQPFKAKNLRVDKVVNAHGLSKRAFKRLVAQSRNVRTGEPMDLAWRLLKGQYPKDDQAWALLKYDINEARGIEALIYHTLENGPSFRHLFNEGWPENPDEHDANCFAFSENLQLLIEEGGGEAKLMNHPDDPTIHQWVYHPPSGLHFDAQTPYGVEDWKELGGLYD